MINMTNPDTGEVTMYYSTWDTAKIIGMCSRTVTRMIERGTLKAKRINRRWYIAEDEVTRIIEHGA